MELDPLLMVFVRGTALWIMLMTLTWKGVPKLPKRAAIFIGSASLLLNLGQVAWNSTWFYAINACISSYAWGSYFFYLISERNDRRRRETTGED